MRFHACTQKFAMFHFVLAYSYFSVFVLQQGLSLIETLEDQGDLDSSTSPVMSQQVQHSLQWMGRFECFLSIVNFVIIDVLLY